VSESGQSPANDVRPGSRLQIVKGGCTALQWAGSAASRALKVSPDYPPYLFKKGYAESHLGQYADAANSFALCVVSSEIMHDGYYLDAARIAQARCLVLDSRVELAVQVIASAASNSATWLDRRFSEEEVMESIRV